MPKFTRNQLFAAYAIVALALLGMGVLIARSGTFRPGGEIKFMEPGASAVSDANPAGSTDVTPPEPQKLCVHVAGRVKTPGLCELPPGSRVREAIKAAGGALSNADLESVNLAEKLEDGQQIYIAQVGKIKPPAVSVIRGGSVKSSGAPKGEAGGKASAPKKLSKPGEGTVNINSANLDQLQRLPGIGPAYAQRIIDYRTQNGRFQAVDELDEVKGIGSKKLEKLRPFVSL
jgi:competence protein ComEA